MKPSHPPSSVSKGAVTSPHHGVPTPEDMHVTLAIEDDPLTTEPPPPRLILAFILGLIPLLGYIGAGIALLDVRQSRYLRRPAHGLAYGTLTVQLLYTILGLTLVVLLFRPPAQSVNVGQDPAALAGRMFLVNLQRGQYDQAQAALETSGQASTVDLLPSYREDISYTPQSVGVQVIPAAKFQDPRLSGYSGRPASFQAWRVSGDNSTSHYFILVVGQSQTGDYKILSLLGLDASTDQTAQTVLQQVLGSTIIKS